MDYSVHPTTPLGVRLAAIKFLQRVILVHSKGVSDPRVRHFHSCLNQSLHPLLQLQNSNDPHLLFVPANHPFLNVAALEAEGHKVTEQCLLTFWNSRYIPPKLIRCTS
jgi:symplekin